MDYDYFMEVHSVIVVLLRKLVVVLVSIDDIIRRNDVKAGTNVKYVFGNDDE